jgi:hypothetical protein
MHLRHLLLIGLAWWATASTAPADGLQKLRSRGAEVYYLDVDLRAAFAKAHPKGLPEAKRKLPAASAPAFDWSTRVVMPHWLAQQRSPHCWLYAAMTAFEWNWAIRNGGPAPALAVQPILDRTKTKGGAAHKLALEELLAHGTATARAYPHIGRPGRVRGVKMTHRAIAWGPVAVDGGVPTVVQIKNALLEQGPLVASVYVTKQFERYKGGIFNEHAPVPKTGPQTDHSVVILGWDDRKGKTGCWKVQNSWGPWWGLAGFMWIEYGSNNIGAQACWVRPQAVHYNLPEDAHLRIGGNADPFPLLAKTKHSLTPLTPEFPTVTPAEALTMAGERVVLDMQVRGFGKSPDGAVFLCSERSLKNDGCVVVQLLQPYLTKFPAQEGQALFRYYQGKRLHVHGSLQPVRLGLADGAVQRLIVEVAAPEQVEVMRRK